MTDSLTDRPKYGDYENLSSMYEESQRYNQGISRKANVLEDLMGELKGLSQKAHITPFEIRDIIKNTETKLQK